METASVVGSVATASWAESAEGADPHAARKSAVRVNKTTIENNLYERNEIERNVSQIIHNPCSKWYDREITIEIEFQ